MIGHDGGFDTDHDQLFDAESYVLTHGRLNNFKLLIYRPQLLPDHFVQALRENTMLSTFHLEFVHLCRRTFDYTNLSEQIQSTLCKCQSVNSIAHSNHTLNVNVVCPNKFSHSITRLCAINNLHMENNNAVMLKIREKCFLYPQLFEMWIQTLQTCNRGSDSDSDDESFVTDSSVISSEGQHPNLPVVNMPLVRDLDHSTAEEEQGNLELVLHDGINIDEEYLPGSTCASIGSETITIDIQQCMDREALVKKLYIVAWLGSPPFDASSLSWLYTFIRFHIPDLTSHYHKNRGQISSGNGHIRYEYQEVTGNIPHIHGLISLSQDIDDNT